MIRLALPLALATVVAAANAQQPSAVKLINTPATNISVSITDPKLVHTVHLEAMEETADTVKITATPLLGPETVKLICTVDGKSGGAGVPVTKGTLIPLVLSGQVNKAGKYTGVLTVDSGSARGLLRLTLVVTKTDLPFPLSLISTDAVALADSGPALFRVSVQEKAGLPQTLNPPEMILLSHRSPDMKGKTQVAAFTAVPLLKETQAMGDKWMVPAHAASSFLMRIDLDNAGEYTGTIRLTSPSTPAALNVPVTIWVRESGWLAGVLIAAGVVFSAGLRWYLGKGRALLLQQRETMQLLAGVSKLRENMRQTYGTEEEIETGVLDMLTQRITSLSGDLDAGKSDSAEATLKELRTRVSMVRDWVVQRRRINGLSEEIGLKLAPEMEKVTQFLQSDSATDLESARTALRALPEKIDEELRAEFFNRIAALRKKVEESTFINDPDEREKVGREVAKHLEDSSKKARAKRFADAATALLDAEAAFAVAIGNELVRRLEAEKVPPLGFDEKSWPALRKNVDDILRSPATDAAQQIRVVQEAFRTYTEGLAANLEALARTRLRLRINEEADPENKKVLEAEYDEALKLLRSAREAGQADDFDTASNHLAKAVSKLTAINVHTSNKAETSGTQVVDFTTMGTAPAAPALDLGAFLINIIGGIGTADPRMAENRADLLKKLVKRIDLVVLVAVLGLAIVVGLKLLWADNVMWGSFSDYLVAILWGLGLHEVTSSSVHGLGGVFGKVSG